MEIWKDIPTYKGLYKVSNLGSVKSLITNRELKPLNVNGYNNVCLCKKGEIKQYGIHRLVYWSFKGILSNKKNQVDHINNIKSDNRLCNLQLLTARQNTIKDYWKPTNTKIGVSKIRGRYRSRITINNKCIHLGYFDTEEEAAQAYNKKLISNRLKNE